MTIEVELFGPFHSRSAMRGTGTPLARSTVKTTGDGRFTSKATRLPKAGFYTYRERIKGSALVTATGTACAEEAETSPAAPVILTVRKTALPASIFARTGQRRLVLVTCGGPFLPDAGHYRDNIVATAKPV